jgi:hypothetical protein
MHIMSAASRYRFVCSALVRWRIGGKRKLTRLGWLLSKPAPGPRIASMTNSVVDRRDQTRTAAAAGTLAVRTAMECGLDLIPRALGEPEERLRGEFWQLTLQSVEALIAGDVAQLFAIRVMQSRFFASSSRWSEMDRAPRASNPRPESTPGLKAEVVSREILRDIRLRGWAVGAKLGGFHELALRYRCTPSVLREAIRILEENSAVSMQLGRGGGLMVGEPDRRKALMRALRYLQAVGHPQANAWRFLDEILLQAVARGCARASTAQIHSLRRAASAMSSVGGASVGAVRKTVLH